MMASITAEQTVTKDAKISTTPSLSYRDAGVDIDAGNALVERIKPLAATTFRQGVVTGLGGFGAMFELPMERFRHPVLVSGTDGVGTKLKLALELERHDTVGIEVPYETRQVVRLRDVIEESYGQTKKMRIPLFLGNDVSGKPIVSDLSALPHLLIAG